MRSLIGSAVTRTRRKIGAVTALTTVVRAAGLFTTGQVSSYRVSDGPLDGLFTSRPDLAACLLAQVGDLRFVNKTIEITTSQGAPTLEQVIWREAFKRR
jgi:hypothetical protein